MQKRRGFTDVSLKKHFPALRKKIVANYAQRRAEIARMRENALLGEMREIVTELLQTGVILALPRATARLKDDSLRH